MVAIDEARGDDRVTFKVTGLERVQSIPRNETWASDGPLTPRRGAQLIRVDLSYKNNMQVPIDLLCGGGQGFVLLDENDRNYRPIDSLLELEGNDEVCGEDVQPGFKADVVLAFQMPKRSDIGGLVMWNTEAEDDPSGDLTQIIFVP